LPTPAQRSRIARCECAPWPRHRADHRSARSACAWAAGTDSVASNNRLDLLEEARCAQIVQRARLRSSGALPGAELIRLVTIEGARALDIDGRVGTIERGKDADLCAVRLDGPHTIPAGQIENTLFHAARGSDVVLTMVQGRVLFDGEVRTLNETDLAIRVREIAERLRCARNEAS
jgi:5-methylthioadenosine/S-adenosylhomocysteine deaminase